MINNPNNNLITKVLDCTQEHKKIIPIDAKDRSSLNRVRTGKTAKDNKRTTRVKPEPVVTKKKGK